MDYADLRHMTAPELEHELERVSSLRWEHIQAGQRATSDALTRRLMAIRHAINRTRKERHVKK